MGADTIGSSHGFGEWIVRSHSGCLDHEQTFAPTMEIQFTHELSNRIVDRPVRSYCSCGLRKKSFRSADLTLSQASRPSRKMRIGISEPGGPLSQILR